MRIAICDDERDYLNEVAKYVRIYYPQAEYVLFDHSRELLQAFESSFFDIVLLDIRMQSPNGFDAAQQLRSRPEPPLIIFITNDSSYSVQGYGIAFRYLMKPLDRSRFVEAMDAAIEQLSPKRLEIRTREGRFYLPVEQIMYCEVKNYNMCIFTRDQTYRTRMTLQELQNLLPAPHFVKPHQSYIINCNFIQSISGNTIMMTGGAKIPISRGRRKQFEQSLFCFLRG